MRTGEKGLIHVSVVAVTDSFIAAFVEHWRKKKMCKKKTKIKSEVEVEKRPRMVEELGEVGAVLNERRGEVEVNNAVGKREEMESEGGHHKKNGTILGKAPCCECGCGRRSSGSGPLHPHAFSDSLRKIWIR